jgi:hypothetical protein
MAAPPLPVESRQKNEIKEGCETRYDPLVADAWLRLFGEGRLTRD